MDHIETQLRELKSDVNEIKKAVIGDGMGILGLASRTAKNEHDIGGLKFKEAGVATKIAEIETAHTELKEEVEVVKQKTVAWEKRDQKAEDESTWRRRTIVAAVIVACTSTVAAQAAMVIKAFSNHEEKAGK